MLEQGLCALHPPRTCFSLKESIEGKEMGSSPVTWAGGSGLEGKWPAHELRSLGAPRINEAIRAAKDGVRKTVCAGDQMVCSLRNGQQTLCAFGKSADKSGLH